MNDNTKKKIKWVGVGLLTLGTIAIIASGTGVEYAEKVVIVISGIIEALKGLL
jgi:hypothetical protein